MITLPENYTRSQLLLAIRERIVNYGTSHIGRESAEDLAQETLMLAEQRYSGVNRLEELLPVAIRIMSFKIKSFRRSVSRKRISDTPVDEMEPKSDSPDAARQLESAQFKEKVFAGIAKLGSRCKRLMLLKLEGRRLPEIREMMGAANMQQVYLWDFRCREKLRELMSEGDKA